MLMSRFIVCLLGLLLAVAPPAFAKGKYTDPDIASYQERHKTVAILPFDVTIQRRKESEGSVEMLAQAEREEGYNLQQVLYVRFLRKTYTVKFQDPSETNVLLERANVPFEDLGKKTKQELAEILGVDAVISGDVRRSKPMSTGAAVATAVLIGFSATNQVTVNMYLHDAQSGKLIWNYNGTFVGGLGSTSDGLADAMMKKTSKKFAYRVRAQ